MSALVIRDAVDDLQEALFAAVDLQIEPPLRHFFADGLYGREITLPEGCIAVGKRHKMAHLVVLSAGRVRVLTEDGAREVSAPATWSNPAGVRNAVQALERSIWTTFHPNPDNETDLNALEARYVEPVAAIEQEEMACLS